MTMMAMRTACGRRRRRLTTQVSTTNCRRAFVTQTVRVAPLPAAIDDSPESRAAGVPSPTPRRAPKCCCLVDVQRATSTLTTAFALGLRRARILPEVDVVLAAAAAEEARTGEKCLLGGERDFVRIPGFDVDNSPRAFVELGAAGHLKDRSLLFTSTNGARALDALLGTVDERRTRSPLEDDGDDGDEPAVVLGSFLNLDAATTFLSRHDDVLLLCSGTHGERSDEDELFAGTVANTLRDAHGFDFADDATRDVADVATHADAQPGFWWRLMSESANARGLRANGLGDDVAFVARVNLYRDVLPIKLPGDPDFFLLRNSPASHPDDTTP